VAFFYFEMESLTENNADFKVRFTLDKHERLCSKKLIDKLFAEAKSVFVFPLKIVYLNIPLQVDYPAQVGFSVSKRNFTRAVARNLIKRKMRETYRLNKPQFYNDLGEKQLVAFFIYVGKTLPEYITIETAMKKGLKKLVKEVCSEPEI